MMNINALIKTKPFSKNTIKPKTKFQNIFMWTTRVKYLSPNNWIIFIFVLKTKLFQEILQKFVKANRKQFFLLFLLVLWWWQFLLWKTSHSRHKISCSFQHLSWTSQWRIWGSFLWLLCVIFCNKNWKYLLEKLSW